MISEAEAPRYLWNLVRDLTFALRAGQLDEARALTEEALAGLTEVVYEEHLTRAQVRGMERVASLLRSGQTEVALELLEGELRNSFLVAPTAEEKSQGEPVP